MGFCMGGHIALIQALDNADVFACVAPFYGSLGGIDPLAMQMPVCGSYGARDTSIPSDDVRAFRDRVARRQRHPHLQHGRPRILRRPARVVRPGGRRRRLEAHVGLLQEIPGAETMMTRPLDPRRLRRRRRSAARSLARRPCRIAALHATLAESQRTGEATIEALLERPKTNCAKHRCARRRARQRTRRSGFAKTRRVRKLMREIESGRKLGCRRSERATLRAAPSHRATRTAAVKLTTETSSLVSALRNPTTRGKWGEVQLRRVVELAGMEPYCDFSEQQTFDSEDGQGRPI